ncbi:hypothetical protein HCN44_001199 [Aphidius gifuensis]|uniref:Origin recognition complex subunit 1 n=1 Tax=Aphidius gifuensis TaxID=684658 RepID=A0A834XMA6_APHGI|nr:origin recognition complex subunit 1 [Aphidius gifuensis]KAF7988626.1 hypothetical protein HCN44_001199 [Aphidius gifuensis]
MSVVLIDDDNCSDNTSSVATTSEKNIELNKSGSVQGLKELEDFFNDENIEVNDNNTSKLSNCDDDYVGVGDNDTSVICETSLVAPTPEKANKTPVKLIKKRKRSDCDDIFSDDDSYQGSPEIPITGPPTIYQSYQGHNQTSIVLKKKMEQKRTTRSQKMSVDQICNLVNDDSSDDDDNKTKTPVKKLAESTLRRTPRVLRTPKLNDKDNENITTPKRSCRKKITELCSTPTTTTTTTATTAKEKGDLKMKIRRSTDQSLYKAELMSQEKKDERRVSLRSKIIDPLLNVKKSSVELSPNNKKSNNNNNSLNVNDGELRRSSRQQKNKKDNDGDEDDEEEEEDYNKIYSPKKTRLQNQVKTPKSIAPSTPSGRPQRSSRKHWNYSEMEIINDTNKENKKADDEKKFDKLIVKQISIDHTMTPKKSSIIIDNKTPRTAKKRVNFDEVSLTPKKSPRKIINNDNNEEPKTPKLETPKRTSKSVTPSLRRNNITPSMKRRLENIDKPKTLLQQARSQLHVSAVPSSLPCRDEEFNEIFGFLKNKLHDKSNGCYYISGVPGTGKTATVNEVIRCLKKLESRNELDAFDYLSINGMKLTEPRQAYAQILKQLTGETMSWEQSYNILEKKFTKLNNKKSMTLLLVDELDLLCNKRQDVVYNLLDWPTKQSSRLIVITIANTMDLPERVLMGKVTSRIGFTRLTFPPYNFKQLQKIVETRLKESDAFRSEAIQLVARKVAETRKADTVLMEDVKNALDEMISSSKVRAIKYCSKMEQIFLQSVCAEITRTGVEEANFRSVYRQFQNLCTFDGFKPPNISQALEICSRLSASRLLLCEHSRADIEQRIILHVSPDDIHYALGKLQL